MITDAGGVPLADGGRIRPGVIFRISGALVVPDEFEPLEAAGLRRVVDMRGASEDRSVIQVWARSNDVDYVSQPIDAANASELTAALRAAETEEEAAGYMVSMYRLIVDDYGEAIAMTIAALADRLPVGYGCAAGKDRTGIVTAFLHTLLGADEEEVVRGYVEGAPAPEQLQVLARDYLSLGEADPLPPGFGVLAGASAPTIRETLDHVRTQHGGVEAYLEAHGLEPETVEKLRNRLVEQR